MTPKGDAKIEERTAEFMAEDTTLRELRKARKLTQVSSARELGITLELESREDEPIPRGYT